MLLCIALTSAGKPAVKSPLVDWLAGSLSGVSLAIAAIRTVALSGIGPDWLGGLTGVPCASMS